MAKKREPEILLPPEDAIPYRAPTSGWATFLRVNGHCWVLIGILLATAGSEPYWIGVGLAADLYCHFIAHLVDKFVQMHYFMKGMYERGNNDGLSRAPID